MTPEERAVSEAHDGGYQDGYDEARAELLVKFAKMVDRGDDVSDIRMWVTERADKAAGNGRWPDGWLKP